MWLNPKRETYLSNVHNLMYGNWKLESRPLEMLMLHH